MPSIPFRLKSNPQSHRIVYTLDRQNYSCGNTFFFFFLKPDLFLPLITVDAEVKSWQPSRYSVRERRHWLARTRPWCWGSTPHGGRRPPISGSVPSVQTTSMGPLSAVIRGQNGTRAHAGGKVRCSEVLPRRKCPMPGSSCSVCALCILPFPRKN